MLWQVVILIISAEATVGRIPIRRIWSVSSPLDVSEMNIAHPLWKEKLHHSYIDQMYMYTATLYLGASPTPYEFVVSTLIADTWLIGDCDYDTELVGAPLINVSYGKARITCYALFDRLCLSPDATCISRQAFTYRNVISRTNRVYGFLGLGFPQIARNKNGPTILQSLNERFYPQLAFSMVLNSHYDDEGSFLIFGNLPDVVGLIQKENDRAPGFVMLPVHPMQGHKNLSWWLTTGTLVFKHQNPEQFPMVLSSETSLLAVPSKHFTRILYSIIPRKHFRQYCSFNRRLNTTFCDCHVPINSMTIKFHGVDDTELSVNLGSDQLLERYRNGRCLFGVTKRATHLVVLGDVFLRHVHAVYDTVGRKIILYARKSKAPTTTEIYVYRVIGFLSGISFMIMFLNCFRPVARRTAPQQQDQYSMLG